MVIMSPISDFSYKSLYINMQNGIRRNKIILVTAIFLIIIAIVLFAFSIVYYENDSKYRNNSDKANDFLTLLFPEYVNYSA